MSDYIPELGQIAFGQPWKPLEPSYELQAAMAFFAEMMPSDENPFSNSGARLDTVAFSAHAYSWNEDEEQQFNFKWRDLEVSWYKYQGRGMSCNRNPSIAEIGQMVSECLPIIIELHEKSK